MPFPNKGQNHYTGIQNEKDIVNYFKKYPNNSIANHLEKENKSSIQSWNHQGGTKQKKDVSYKLNNDKTYGISIKNHKRGTFDYENNSKCIPEDLKKKIVDFKNKNINKSIPKKGGIRNDLANIFSLWLDNLTSDEITQLLDQIYKKEQDTKHILINHIKIKQLILIDKSNLDLYFNCNNNHTYILKSTPRAKTSRQIWIVTADGNKINTNLRIRLTLNNGITALLGKSKANKNAAPCFKIQQDNVDLFISKCVGNIVTDYSPAIF
jgi:hypothetical protein